MGELKRGDAKRAALLKAAAELIMSRGIDGTTTREIADRAQSTERTLFKQFGSKAGLITAVLDMVALAQLDQSPFSKLVDSPPRTLDAFEGWHRDLLVERLTAQAPASDVGRLFLFEILQNPTFKARYSGAWRTGLWQPLIATLQALRSSGEIDSAADAEFLGLSFINLSLGYLVARLQVAPGADWDTQRDAARIAGLFRRAIEVR